MCQLGVLMIFALLVRTGLVSGCFCPAAIALLDFPPEVPADVCCLNYSGSAFSHVPWSAFTNWTKLEILDLSDCNISSVGMSEAAGSTLREVYLSHNQLVSLPMDFLANESSLMVLDLGWNLLQELPKNFLQDSNNLKVLDLQGNQLRFLPRSVLQHPSLQRLELHGNPWDCSCSFMESLVESSWNNQTSKMQVLVGNITCVSPQNMAGRVVWSLSLSDVCRLPGLTVLFIVLPLLILSTLVICWWCGRKKKKKEMLAFSTSKKKASSANCNGQKHRPKPQPVFDHDKTGDLKTKGILKNQMVLHPASILLGSTKDISDEVQTKDSVESLHQASSHCSSSTDGKRGSQEPDAASKSDLDTVSVTEVMKDSADREKAYLTQSTEYYSLVPGINLEDSDQGEYESVDLS
ncbi:leucine-rich repeat-containing protein 38 [Thalassophryne amazonica]|uniref:leucine-rich repeat-containing protein 38 n=1 Tax=Thalassophryne amazonica TaxID=390379 RepID=UPI0014711D2E|nr:leucine-rich repeat-containing protein 38 [Thalassophryne amazonica]